MMRISVKRLTAVAAIAGAFATGGVVASRAEDASAGDAVNGKRLYLADGCFECHGRAGQGGRFNYLTPALAQIALPVESFIAFLREAPNDMPSFSADVLSDKDAADIHAYLNSLPGPKAAKDIPPILNQ
ncbi:c-type cytochrome [Bradyrhizobium erythrophlei]|uniref:Cytochrome c, mono-and diheme variants n=1 Tax=Bradyrhizobium erythrophlei TaxID=1437360 RepID=A0A1H4Z9J9_9BRAD|nr:cytochrome c [Bradyrhizobium erythrophlei]SED26040.1 Cytochrome c, mono-and diheme variants [Bradyrhizobium erythrophlei]